MNMLPDTCSVFVIFLMFRRSSGDSVTQTEGLVTLSEGAPVTLNCTYQTTYSNVFLFWYVQYLNKAPQLLLKGATENQRKKNQGFEVTLIKKNNSFHLHKSSVQLSDSAVYYCAVTDRTGAGYGKLVFGQGTIFMVHPNIQDPAPAVYQLRDTKSSKNSVCLFTDFDSQVNVSHLVDSEMFISDKTVLDMKSMDSKSNGALAWSNKTDFKCTDVFTENTFTASSDISCDANLVEKSFETDMNLNFQNLSVMGLRILLLKVAGFNLLMTLRLWSS